ncbi:hypothetical protein [Shimia ponticola]|uniref:hypothetical protein n=1 Tax=Shimia ponticola TaxID=2582893 RepID=UPI00164A37CC|nr:hypothetical protein [Shimia ponticola]
MPRPLAAPLSAQHPRPRRRIITAVMLVGVAAIALAVRLDVAPLLTALHEQAVTSHTMRWTFLVIYAVLLALPFVPGVEIGLALLMLFGASFALPVYVATITGLTLAYGVGRTLRRLKPTAGLEAALQPNGGLSGLGHATWLGPLLRFRWVAIALLINFPGNTLIGGGGGVAMASGYSLALRWPAFIGCVAVAVAPVPAMVVLAEVGGVSDGLGAWLASLITS